DERPRRERSAFGAVEAGLNVARVHTAARAVGLARAAVEDSILYTQQRVQFEHPIADFQAVRFKLAEMAARVEQARAFYRQVGQRMRHARGATVGDVEGTFIAKQVMNTAQAHWNEHALLPNSPFGAGRVVFGLITASLVFGLASQDTAENALAEVGCDALRFT